MQHLIAYARNERNADYADAEAEKEFKNAVLNFKFESVDEHGIDNGKKQNRYRHHKEKIIRSAARMQPAVFFRAGGNKFILRFIAGNCFMLRTVIHKKPLHVFYAGTAEKITDINSHAQNTLDERTPKALCLPENHRRNQLRKKHKKPDSKRNAKHKRNCYCDVFNGFSESFCKPFSNFVGSSSANASSPYIFAESIVVDMPVVSDSTSATTPRITGSPQKVPFCAFETWFL